MEAVTMHHASFRDFEADALTQGFDVAVERQWDPDTQVPEHGHPFAVKALMVRGEMWLTVGGETRHLRAGEWFELARDVRHAERYGSEGAVYWVARRNGPTGG